MSIIRSILSKIFTFISLRKVKHGLFCKCNALCRFTKNTSIGNNCHFNGAKVTGHGKVTIGDNFHSANGLRILTSYHNYDSGKYIPYDETVISKDVIIEDNVWIGESVIILAGVSIGEGAIVQAGSVVCNDLAKYSISGGHPAKQFKTRDIEHYEELKSRKMFF